MAFRASKKIIAINPLNGRACELSGTKITAASANKGALIASFVPFEWMMSAKVVPFKNSNIQVATELVKPHKSGSLLTLQMAQNGVSEDKLKEELVLSARAQLGLGALKDYEMSFALGALGDYSAFVMDDEDLRRFDEVIARWRYIDWLTPSPLLFGGLYEARKLRASGVDAFVYISEEGAFFSIYERGEFVLCKLIINGGFRSAFEARRDFSGDLDSYIAQIVAGGELTKGFCEQFLMELISALNHIQIRPERVFVSSSAGRMDGLISELDGLFDGVIRGVSFIDEWGLEGLVLLSGDANGYFNAFKRPPKLHELLAGRILITAGVAAVLGAILPVWWWVNESLMLREISRQNEINSALEREIVASKDGIDGLKRQLDSAQNGLAAAQNELKGLELALQSALDKKQSSGIQAINISELAAQLNALNANAKSIEAQEAHIVMQISAKSSATITKLIESVNGLDRFRAHTAQILKKGDEYECELRIEVLSSGDGDGLGLNNF